MAIENPPFSVRRGNDRLVEIEVENEDGSPVTWNGARIRLTYARSAGGTPIKTRTEADLSLKPGLASFRMPPAETLSLEAFRTYWIECVVTFPDGTADGFRESVTTGSFTVEETQG